MTIEPLYDRTHLIDQTLDTVLHNLAEGGALVVVILLLLLGNIRGGLIVALAIPLSMLFAANIMLATGVTASLMSLGAIDFGMIVDSSVIMVENCVRRLAHEGGSRPKLDIIRDAAVEVRKPTMFGELIIAIVYLPILALQGTEGKLFRPMALTVIFALAGSMVLSLTLMPVLASMVLSSKTKEKEVWLVRLIKYFYTPALDAVVRKPILAATGLALALIGVSVPVAMNLGGEFMPKLNEGDLVIEALRIPSAVAGRGGADASTQIEDILKKYPEVRMVYSKTGRPEIANDVMGVHQTDVWVMLKPPGEWRDGLTRDGLIEEMDAELSENVPGVKFGFSQPIEMRVNELVAGVKSDVAALIAGPDLDVLREKAARGREDPLADPGGRGHQVPQRRQIADADRVSVRRDQLARYGIKANDVLDAVAALGGTTVGTVFEGQKRYAIQVRLPALVAERPRPDRPDQGGRPQGERDPDPGPRRRSSHRGRPQRDRARERPEAGGTSGCNVRGRDIASFVARGPGRDRQGRPQDARLPDPLGGPVRAPPDGHATPPDRRADRPAADLPAALQHVRLGPPGRPDLPGRAHRGDRGDLRPGHARELPFSISAGRRLHRPVRRRRAQRPGLGERRGAPPIRRRRAPRGRPRGLARPAPADPDDRPRRRLRLHPDGPGHHPRRRDPEAPGHGRHRRAGHLDHADRPRPAGDLPVVRGEAEGDCGLRDPVAMIDALDG